jgi:hypothetical protein
MPNSHISDAMQGIVGREMRRQVSYPVSASDIRRWAIAVYYPEAPPRAFIDLVEAAKTRAGGVVAPREFNPFAWGVAEFHGRRLELDANDPDRSEKLLGIEGPGLQFQLNGGIETEYGAFMRPDDVITSVSRIAEYREREGRLGLMLFTVLEDLWTNQDGVAVKRNRLTHIRY